jgi:hypothetical protein
MRALFGQVCWGRVKSSPNASLIRTGSLWKSQKQSECEPYSDRFVGEESKAVRMRASFGQVCWGRAKSSPNASLIRTGLLGKSQKQSECQPHSDRFVVEEPKAVRMPVSFGQVCCGRAKAVRMRASFGQVCWGKAKSSPKTSLIRTGTVGQSPNQSECQHHSDRNSRK